MRTLRVYEPNVPLVPNSTIQLNEDASAHLLKVLRQKKGALVNVFDGLGHEVTAQIIEDKKICVVQILKEIKVNNESPLNLQLAQVLSKGDRMDYTIQKAVELGIKKIYPLTSQHCQIKLDDKRQEKKQQSFQKIAISACEQSGRAFVPKVLPIMPLTKFIESVANKSNLLILDPKESLNIKDLKLPEQQTILLVGPEGGLDNSEVEFAKAHGAQGILLGPRILRTETAALVALSILGSHFGDL